MCTKIESLYRKVLQELKTKGLILSSDAILPSVAGIVSGEPIHGSWWSHKKANDIFLVIKKLATYPDAICPKLISGKVTYIHRDLWKYLITIGESKCDWQIQGLSPLSKKVLQKVEKSGNVQSDQLKSYQQPGYEKLSVAINYLEKNLLVYGEQFHSETGAHHKLLQSWKSLAMSTGLKLTSNPSVSQAQSKLGSIVTGLNEHYGAKGNLPWGD